MAFGWKKWTAKDLDLLSRLIAENASFKKMARIFNRDIEQVRRKAREKNMIPKRGFPELTRPQKRELRRFVAQGYNAREISQNHMLGEAEHLVNQNYIQKQMGKLRLVNKNRSRSATKRWVAKPAESRGLNRFIVLHSHELSAKQIAKKYGIKPGTVSARQRQLGVKPSLSEVMKLPEIRRKYLAGMRRRSRKMLANFPKHIAELEKKLLMLTEKMQRNQDRVPFEEKTCHKCGATWPRHQAFFFYREYRLKSGGGVSWHFSSPCKICISKARHEKRV